MHVEIGEPLDFTYLLEDFRRIHCLDSGVESVAPICGDSMDERALYEEITRQVRKGIIQAQARGIAKLLETQG